MRGSSCENFFGSQLSTLTQYRLNWTNTLPATTTYSVDKSGYRISAVKEINSPAIEVYAINQVLFSLGWFTEMFTRWVIWIGNRTFTISIIDRILAPNITLANVNTFFFGKEP